MESQMKSNKKKIKKKIKKRIKREIKRRIKKKTRKAKRKDVVEMTVMKMNMSILLKRIKKLRFIMRQYAKEITGQRCELFKDN